MMHRLLKILSPPLQWAYRWYLKKPRPYRYKGIRIMVRPGVFYPRFIFSTRIMLDYLDRRNLQGKRFLEIGAGSGILSLLAFRKGAIVTATEINPEAIENIRENAEHNRAAMLVIQSDLLENVREKEFDLIVITPPYYPKDPRNFAEMAWFCGSGFEYFQKLFPQLKEVALPFTEIIMILSEDCQIERIKAIADQSGFRFTQIKEVRRYGEWNYIFWISSYEKSIL